jgi:hypothetical protein
MVFVMKKKILTKKDITIFTISILRCLKKNLNLQENIIYFHVLVMYLSSYYKCKGPIQVLASSLKNHKIINSTLEFNVKTS